MIPVSCDKKKYGAQDGMVQVDGFHYKLPEILPAILTHPD